ncbi:NLR family CARD domain-containing protein 4-like [Branchiostoma floridae]|uniref:NLR family CARD domain-containing protein 4-like n=1 Tax=Branchiostoma floridae TaxID=7739 RepID=A0A9J7LQM1_BRAFL|nr:NLR family CARD domain-containing protein 4-like [Branchiostoma floridae]
MALSKPSSPDPVYTTALGTAPDDIIACLKDLYATEYAHVRPLPWCEDLNLHLGEVYTNLQLQRRDGRGNFQDTGTIVSLSGIYNTREGKDNQGNVRSAVRKIRVEGDPGIGKSCSCQKLAYDWSCGKLERFKVVFFMEMRHLAGKVKDAIFEQLLPKDAKSTPDQLWTYIQENQDDVLFILDGLDEISQTAREVTDVVDLIQGKILRNCHVLVTSRPYHCVDDLDRCHQFYKIVGYSRESSEGFIQKYFCQSPGAALKLVEQIHGNENLSELVVNPLNNVLICVVWEDNNNTLPSSKAELYEMIILSVAKRFCTKKNLPMEGDQLPPNIKEALRDLRKLSWEGLEQEQLQFNIDEIGRKYETTADNMLNMGLLTRDYSFSRIKRTCFCAFLHKSFQEYMAACYISGLVTDGSSREEGMTCIRSLFGFTNSSAIDRELILSSRRRYREFQNWLPLTLGENADPLFDMFAEKLRKAQTDEHREVLSFVCIMLLGKTSAGGRMAEIVAPFLPQHLTNNLGDLNDRYNDRDHIDWFVGLTHVLTCQKKLRLSEAPIVEHIEITEVTVVQHMDEAEADFSEYDRLLAHMIRKQTCLRTLKIEIDQWCHKDIEPRGFVYHGVCNSQSLSNLCSAIQRNRSLETLVIDGMLSESLSGRQAKILAKLMEKLPSNYKELKITMLNGL